MMALTKNVLRLERQAIFETQKRLMNKKGLSASAALKEAWRDAKSPSGTFTKSVYRSKK